MAAVISRRHADYPTLRRRHDGCSDERQHHYVVLGKPGLRSPVCVHCGNPWFRNLTEDEWETYEQYWRDERHMIFRDEFVLGERVSVEDSRHAWAAGFLDGEGSFQGYISEKRLLLCISAAQVDKRPLLILQELYGGSCLLIKNNRQNQRDHWVWQLRSARSLRVLIPVLMPHLVVKIEQAETLYDLCSLVGGKGRHSLINEPGNQEARRVLVDRLKSLKREV